MDDGLGTIGSVIFLLLRATGWEGGDHALVLYSIPVIRDKIRARVKIALSPFLFLSILTATSCVVEKQLWEPLCRSVEQLDQSALGFELGTYVLIPFHGNCKLPPKRVLESGPTYWVRPPNESSLMDLVPGYITRR
jgi:hypothetical protein